MKTVYMQQADLRALASHPHNYRSDEELKAGVALILADLAKNGYAPFIAADGTPQHIVIVERSHFAAGRTILAGHTRRAAFADLSPEDWAALVGSVEAVYGKRGVPVTVLKPFPTPEAELSAVYATDARERRVGKAGLARRYFALRAAGAGPSAAANRTTGHSRAEVFESAYLVSLLGTAESRALTDAWFRYIGAKGGAGKGAVPVAAVPDAAMNELGRLAREQRDTSFERGTPIGDFPADSPLAASLGKALAAVGAGGMAVNRPFAQTAMVELAKNLHTARPGFSRLIRVLAGFPPVGDGPRLEIHTVTAALLAAPDTDCFAGGKVTNDA